METIQKNNRKFINAWAMYDWANSVYSLVIVATIFPIYYNAVTRSAFNGTESLTTVRFFGLEIINTVLFDYAISFSFFIVAILSPILSGIADVVGNKKYFMQAFVTIGSLACCGMALFDGKNIEYGIICAVLGSIGFAGSLVFYNSYLPEIATPDRFDSISAKGFSLGYIGSVILMIFNLTMLLKPEWYFDVDREFLKIGILNPDYSNEKAMQLAKDSFSGLASKISFLTVGIWWFGFSLITFFVLPNVKKSGKASFTKGFHELSLVWNQIKTMDTLKYFLIAYFFYNMAVQTVMYLAAQFGDAELHLPSGVLIGVILSIQLVAIAGAQLFAKISQWKGNFYSLMIMISIWMVICIAAYYVNSQLQFQILAVVVGLVMGGIQSLSRSTYSKLLPETEDNTSFFSFYDVMEKIGLIIGPIVFGTTTALTGSMRNAVIPLFVFFIIGMVILLNLVKKIGWLKAIND